VTGDEALLFLLRPIQAEDTPEVQRLYEAAPEVFRRLIGRPAPPDQAANDFAQAQEQPGRFRFLLLFQDQPVGLADCKLDDEIEGLAHIGLLLLIPPYDDPLVTELALRILERWLSGFAVHRLQVGVLAHLPGEVAFWRSQGFAFTGEQHRRNLPGYAPRFLIMERSLSGDS
jgi:hypothetical protein